MAAKRPWAVPPPGEDEDREPRAARVSVQQRFPAPRSAREDEPIDFDSLEIDGIKINFTDEQKRIIYTAVRQRKPVFITGFAGTGKSAVMKAIIALSDPEEIRVTAFTGIAAINISTKDVVATTIHMLLRLGIGKSPASKIAKNMDQERVDIIRKCVILIIDECSMGSARIVELIDDVLRLVREVDLPFGGVALVLTGDFAQLQPISREGEPRELLAFESPRWAEWFPPACRFMLHKVHRQSDEEFISVLREVRDGRVSPKSIEYLKGLSRPLTLPTGVTPTRLYAHNKDADECNMRHLRALDTAECTFPARNWINPRNGFEFHKNAYEKFDKSSLSGDFVARIGAVCMCIVNLAKVRVYNGMQGIVVGFSYTPEPCVKVYWYVLERVVDMFLYEWAEKTLAGTPMFTRHAMPLRLAWGITIHKSQGMNLRYMEANLDAVNQPGMAYVALSRAMSPEGLRVVNLTEKRITADEKVARFYSDLERYEFEMQRSLRTDAPADAPDAEVDEFPCDDSLFYE
jgi:ATP-dependent DNA helicase PIF1